MGGTWTFLTVAFPRFFLWMLDLTDASQSCSVCYCTFRNVFGFWQNSFVVFAGFSKPLLLTVIPTILWFLWTQMLLLVLSCKKNGDPDSNTSIAKHVGLLLCMAVFPFSLSVSTVRKHTAFCALKKDIQWLLLLDYHLRGMFRMREQPHTSLGVPGAGGIWVGGEDCSLEWRDPKAFDLKIK